LFRAVFYYNGKNFVLRGGQEHRELQISQIVRFTNRYEYTENSSKIGVVGWHSCVLSTKKCLSVPTQQLVNVAMCTYLTSTLASFQQQLRREAAFIGNQWQVSLPVLRPLGLLLFQLNSLGKVVSEMFREAGIKELKTNHSLRAAGVSQLFEAGVDEKIIQSRLGHRSTDALRVYV